MGVVPLDELPVRREVYDTQLRAGGSTEYKAGYLPYSIVDGWQQIRKDLAYWRADVKGAETATTPEERAWCEADRRLREKLTLRDIGIWSHYGDASPLHVSVPTRMALSEGAPYSVRPMLSDWVFGPQYVICRSAPALPHCFPMGHGASRGSQIARISPVLRYNRGMRTP
jgi:hypothetical protein